MSGESTKAEAVRYWRDKALESLTAARRELSAGAYAFAINRAYYALFMLSALCSSKRVVDSGSTVVSEQRSIEISSNPVA